MSIKKIEINQFMTSKSNLPKPMSETSSEKQLRL